MPSFSPTPNDHDNEPVTSREYVNGNGKRSVVSIRGKQREDIDARAMAGVVLELARQMRDEANGIKPVMDPYALSLDDLVRLSKERSPPQKRKKPRSR